MLYAVRPTGSCGKFKAKKPEISKIEKPNISEGSLIALTQGRFAIVDAADYDWLIRYKWRADKHYRTWYAMRSEDRTTVSMHRQIMKVPEGLVVDHIDHNGLNNRRSNLRVCTRSQNQCNQRRFGGKSKYKGVTWLRHTKKWAAKVYDRKASELHGEFAHLNFPESVGE